MKDVDPLAVAKNQPPLADPSIPEKSHQINIKVSDIPAKLVDDLKMLRGLPPYDDRSNLSLNDNYFSANIDREFGTDMVEAAEILIIEPMEQELEQLKNDLGKKYSPGQ